MIIGEVGSLLSTKTNTWAEQFVNYLPNIIAAVIVLGLFALLSKLLRNYMYKLSGKLVVKGSLKRFVTTFFQVAFVSVGILIALSILNLGKAITSLLAGAGVAGLIIGFAMQEIIANYFSGVTISVSDPFKIGDLVEIDGEIGVVDRIQFRTTTIRTPTGQILEMPNKNVINNKIINFTQTGERRVDIESGIAYGDDPELARKIALEVIENTDGVSKDKPIEFFYTEFGDSSLKFVLRFWMDFDSSQKEYFELKSEALTQLLSAYDENGITMPYPTTTVRMGQ